MDWIRFEVAQRNCLQAHSVNTRMNARYDVWLKPLQLEQLVRTEDERGAISEGSLFKLKVKETGVDIQLAAPAEEKTRKESAFLKKSETLQEGNKEEIEGQDDYYRSFKVVLAGESQQYILFMLSDLARYIRTFDIETAKRYSDYTEDALLKILSKALKRLKLMCINGLPATIQSAYPYKQPIEYIQRVNKDVTTS